jgi:DNA ligase 1
VLLRDVADASADVAATTSRREKIARLAACLARLSAEEVPVAVAYLAGRLPQGSIGVGWAALRKLPTPTSEPTLELCDVDATIARIAEATGPGSQEERRAELTGLLGRATDVEQRFLVGLLLGELRQGALEGVVTSAVADAAGVPVADVRRALMLTGDLGAVASLALGEGRKALAEVGLVVLRPLQPMLAGTAEDVSSALERISPAIVEWKLDGARIQVHRTGDEVRVFTRNLADVTSRVPEIVSAVRELPVESAILDGEAIALRPDGRPLPFQVTMSRFGSRVDVDRLAEDIPLSPFFFDVLHLDGADLLDLPARDRLDALDRAVPSALRVPRIETSDRAAAQAFLEATLGHGHEGVLVKSPDAAYESGRRGAGWLKVKVAHTLDLVVLAAEWGHGRRQGRLSNLHLGARDPAGGCVMLGKTFKGLTDAMLEWQTEHLLELEERREGNVVHVRPALVVEVAFDGVQSSTRYPGGVALRFARVKGYRPDKRPDEADTIDAVRAVHARGGGS